MADSNPVFLCNSFSKYRGWRGRRAGVIRTEDGRECQLLVSAPLRMTEDQCRRWLRRPWWWKGVSAGPRRPEECRTSLGWVFNRRKVWMDFCSSSKLLFCSIKEERVSESATEMLLPSGPETGQRCGLGWAWVWLSPLLRILLSFRPCSDSCSGPFRGRAGPAQQTLATFEVRMLENKYTQIHIFFNDIRWLNLCICMLLKWIVRHYVSIGWQARGHQDTLDCEHWRGGSITASGITPHHFRHFLSLPSLPHFRPPPPFLAFLII